MRGELFGVERLEEHARSLAVAQSELQKSGWGLPLARRLAANEAMLLKVYRTMVDAIDEGRAITPASEWLIDNYHLVEKQMRQIRSDLPPGYYRQLPKLATGPFVGYPRVFGMAWAFVAHTDSQFDPEILRRFVRAYQEVQPLTIGELWAIAITLRIVLIENLARIAAQLFSSRIARRQADLVADRLLGAGDRIVEAASTVFADLEKGRLLDAFAVQLVHRLRDQDPRITPALAWLDQRLAAFDTTVDQVVREEHRRQGAANVTVRNIITSLRLISDVDWKELFERCSLVDEVFAAAGLFRDMDFPTRNLYRSAVEELARRSDRSELEVANAAMAAAGGSSDPRRADPGFYLISAGRPELEAAIGFRPTLRQWPQRMNRLLGILGYATAIQISAALIISLPLTGLAFAGLETEWLCQFALVGIIPALDAAIALVNHLVTTIFSADPLPAMELRQGIPPDLRTLVAVPMLLTSPEAVAEQVERLEVHFLASAEGHLHFALLSDWPDAASERVDGDDGLLAAASEGIARLNERYGRAPGGARFLLLHRRRVWAESEGRWMGWERKRGKLHELNRLLRGATDTNFLPLPKALGEVPSGIRYVITLDADTRLPRDTVRRLIGKMAHPLNRPHFDPATGRVLDGYAVLQPRVTPSLPTGRDGSFFQSIFSSLSGIDPYAAAISDVYQDLFGEGSYAGKGIYDVDAFEAALAGRVPPGTMLSHDLFEGIFARAGLASDVEVVEDFPARYDVGARRQHRWARGDWQLLPWILRDKAPHVGTTAVAAVVPAIGRWKMLDNLRRSLSAPVSIASLILGWAMPFDAAMVWTVFVIATIVVPPLLPILAAIPPRRPGITIGSHFRVLAGDLGLSLTLSALIVTFLAHQAWLMGDAILRTLYRLFVSRRLLLEWLPAAQAAQGRPQTLASSYRLMAGAPVIAIVGALVALLSGNDAWPLACAFAALWMVSPAVAHWASLPPRSATELPVAADEIQVLRLSARRTWRFFEAFVTPLDNMLPPDNFQEDPAPVVAHRTSPTNIGLYLLSVASAHDFGWIGLRDAVERLEASFATMRVMERYRGHFYNWYDTTDLRPLDPKYVSSVDSGNLAGHLIALANACREWRDHVYSTALRFAGIGDAIELARLEAARLRDGHRTQTVTLGQLEEALEALAALIRRPVDDAEGIAQVLLELTEQGETAYDIARAFAAERGGEIGVDLVFWAHAAMRAIEAHSDDFRPNAMVVSELDNRLLALENAARSTALEMEFDFLLDRERNLLSIGFVVPEGKLDANCYDLLASEARLASFVAIAKGDLAARHWFRLGRASIPVGRGTALISWSGSMFEYLMPSLIMRAPTGSLLEQTSRLAVRRQIDYATTMGLPWGISESAYNARDREFTYQYSNFGVPGLGLKRGLGEDIVVAPYATALATMVEPRAAAANMHRLTDAGARGRFGFYEALDYTATRVPEGQTVAVVRAYMAHHQGMSIVAIADALFGGIMRSRFHAEPMVQATELVLQERPPREVSALRPWAAEVKTAGTSRDVEPAPARRFTSPHQTTPATHLLSNGRYATMLTSAGSGYSRWRDLAVTRWREDATCDDFGSYVFLRDIRTGHAWSAAYQPTGIEPDDYEVVFNEDRVDFVRQDGNLTTALQIIVSTEHDAEVRRVSVSNGGSRMREIEVTSYAELVLAPQAADVAHPAFSKLFVQTEYLADVGAILATRRRRAPSEPEVWAAHLAVVEGDVIGNPEIETDRARFIGRGHTIRTPIAAIDGRALSGTVGTVLDPIFALRRRIRIAPGAIARIAFWTLLAPTRDKLLAMIDKHRDVTAFVRAATLAWTQARVEFHHLGATASEAGRFQRLAGHVIYAAPTMRPVSDAIRRGSGAQPGLWSQGISGDLPIVLLRISDVENLALVRELLKAHEYWRMRKLAVDLVILNERQASYVQDLQIAIEMLVRANQAMPHIVSEGPQGNVFVLRTDLVTAETRALLISVARVVLVAQRGGLFDQLDRIPETSPAGHPALRRAAPALAVPAVNPVPDLEFFNGLGGFAEGGKEYVTVLAPGQATPAPWINVVANPQFGFQAATEGGGYTWSVNSREHQLTPWSNDPISDRSGEAFYLRDEDSGDMWSPTALPVRSDSGTYVCRHGRGYCRFEHTSHEISSDLVQFVPLEGSIKISRLTLRNRSARVRRLGVSAYVEWVLGPSRAASLPFVITEIDNDTGAMLARNPWSISFGTRVAFIDFGNRQTDWTADRSEFIGRNGSLSRPLGVVRGGALSNTVGAGLDPCGAMRTTVELPPGGNIELVFLLGDAVNADEARRLVSHFRNADLDGVRLEVARHWDDLLGTCEVRTPDRSMDIMLNGWLLYQSLACRIWARSAFYQASGAYGFRDQLQDGMALAAVRPALTREHLLRAAARQFTEGDVQHWWLPHSEQGVRTRISDDRVWLAHAVGHYIEVTGDAPVLDEVVSFLEGRMLDATEHDSFFRPNVADQRATLFEHCARALDGSLAVGPHGLPLIGTGDWNDGMNRVGEGGKGESVWLGWLLHATLLAFAPVAESRNDPVRAAVWRAHAASLQAALEREAWDGDWYRRGFFDDGTPLGSAASTECRIDSIAQSWAVLSAAAEPQRAARAMSAVERELILPDERLALLFAPPFDKTPLEPGYIKGYPPGIRENGGQYTHAALWSVMAFASLGDGDKAAALFSLLNPINHARTRAGVHRYKVEPYVVAADVYAGPPHVGRGGWTWYTGSGGWMQRAGIESILGLRRRGAFLEIDPCIPRSWPGFEVSLRHGSSRYEIHVDNAAGVNRGVRSAEANGLAIEGRPARLPLVDDGEVHKVSVRLG